MSDNDFGDFPGWLVQVATIMSDDGGEREYVKWSFESMLWVGSEELGSFQTRY